MSSKPTLRSGFSEEPKKKQLTDVEGMNWRVGLTIKELDGLKNMRDRVIETLFSEEYLSDAEPETYPQLTEDLWEKLMAPLDQEPVGSIKLIK